jgi:protein-S-isoprenylcysteine O-methyltransferase Ste14
VISRRNLKQFFGVGPYGVLFTISIWGISILIERVFKIPQLPISSFLRIALSVIFSIDVLYLLIGSNYQRRKHDVSNVLLTEGPYQFIRHPIYSVWIFSFTGLLSMYLLSWTIIISVIPIAIFWSWLVTYEENEMLNKHGKTYQDYMNRTGQFLPSWKAMKESMEQA